MKLASLNLKRSYIHRAHVVMSCIIHYIIRVSCLVFIGSVNVTLLAACLMCACLFSAHVSIRNVRIYPMDPKVHNYIPSPHTYVYPQERVEGVSEGIQHQSRELQPPPRLPQGRPAYLLRLFLILVVVIISRAMSCVCV